MMKKQQYILGLKDGYNLKKEQVLNIVSSARPLTLLRRVTRLSMLRVCASSSLTLRSRKTAAALSRYSVAVSASPMR